MSVAAQVVLPSYSASRRLLGDRWCATSVCFRMSAEILQLDARQRMRQSREVKIWIFDVRGRLGVARLFNDVIASHNSVHHACGL